MKAAEIFDGARAQAPAAIAGGTAVALVAWGIGVAILIMVIAALAMVAAEGVVWTWRRGDFRRHEFDAVAEHDQVRRLLGSDHALRRGDRC